MSDGKNEATVGGIAWRRSWFAVFLGVFNLFLTVIITAADDIQVLFFDDAAFGLEIF